MVRGFYAVNDFRTPVRVAAWMVGLNLVLNLTLIWPMAEAGLAVSTSVAAAVQVFVLVAIFSRRQAPLGLATAGRHGHSHDSRDPGDGRPWSMSCVWPPMPDGGRPGRPIAPGGRAACCGHGGLLRRLLVAGRTRIGYAAEWKD